MTLAILFPVLEEIVFRGFVQEKLDVMTGRSRLGVLSVANIVTSLLFTAFHFINHPPLWALLVLFPSLIFGYSKDRYVSLGAPVVLHVVYNSVYYMTFGTD